MCSPGETRKTKTQLDVAERTKALLDVAYIYARFYKERYICTLTSVPLLEMSVPWLERTKTRVDVAKRTKTTLEKRFRV